MYHSDNAVLLNILIRQANLVSKILVPEDPPGEGVVDVCEQDEGAEVDGDRRQLQHGDVAEGAQPAQQPQPRLGQGLSKGVESFISRSVSDLLGKND